VTGIRARLHLLAVGVAAALLLSGGAGARAEPAVVKFGIMLTSLSHIDPAGGSFDFKAYVWLTDPTGRIDPARDFQVLARRATVRVIESEDLPDGSRYSALEVEGTIDHTFDIRDFPFDTQTLPISFETQFPADVLVLEARPDDSLVADFTTVAGWDVQGLGFNPRVVEYPTRFGHDIVFRFSRMTVEVDILRNRTVLVIEKFIGYTVALLIASLIYFVPPDQIGVRIGMVSSAIFAAVGNRYGIDSVLGAETTFGLVDSLSLIVFGAIYTALVSSLVVHRLHHRRTAAAAVRVDRWTGVGAVTISWGLAILAIALART